MSKTGLSTGQVSHREVSTTPTKGETEAQGLRHPMPHSFPMGSVECPCACPHLPGPGLTLDPAVQLITEVLLPAGMCFCHLVIGMAGVPGAMLWTPRAPILWVADAHMRDPLTAGPVSQRCLGSQPLRRPPAPAGPHLRSEPKVWAEGPPRRPGRV